MDRSLVSRIRHAWDVFKGDPIMLDNYKHLGPASSRRPDRYSMSFGNDKSTVGTVYNRIAMDVAAIDIKHVRLDKNDRYTGIIDSGLNECLTLNANIDQTGRAFIHDVAMSLFDEGCVAIVPVETSTNPHNSNSYDIHSLRTGQILEWYPEHVRVRLYNEKSGEKEDLTLHKKTVAIIENPMYTVMNEPNSTLKRLVNNLRKLDNNADVGKLDIIIQLPYVLKSQARQDQAEERRRHLEEQLEGSKYGIGYIDGTEKITQLNRPAENNLMAQIEYLTRTLYNELGLTESIFDGTADEKTMVNYHNRTIEPVLAAIIDEIKRKFLTKTARTQKQSIMMFREPFKLVPVSDIADIADKFTRNEILSSNEVRAIVGYKPVADPAADELRNKNLNQSKNIQNGSEPEIKEGDDVDG